jgi:hypothetical protein
MHEDLVLLFMNLREKRGFFAIATVGPAGSAKAEAGTLPKAWCHEVLPRDRSLH